MNQQQMWWQHIRGEKPPFSRDVAFPHRLKANTKQDYINYIQQNEGENNCFTSVYSDYLLKQNKYDKLFVDLDRTEKHNTLRSLRAEMLKFVNELEEKFDCSPRVYFSGNGFAVYIDFAPVELETPDAMRRFVLDQFDTEVLDTHPLGDRRRVSRIPFTRNVKDRTPSNRWCVPIKPKWSVHRILQASKNPEPQEIIKEPSDEVAKTVEKYDYVPQREEIDYEVDPEANHRDLQKIKQIVKNRPAREECFDGRHRLMHFVIVPRMLELDCDRDKIHSFCKMVAEETGMNYETEYRDYVDLSIDRTKEGPRRDEIWRPWSWETFFVRNPDLWSYYENEEVK